MGLAVAVTVVCRRSRDASVRENGVVLVGRRGVFGDRRRGARSWSDGRRERSSRGCRSIDIGAADDGWRGGIVIEVEDGCILEVSCKLQVPSASSRRFDGAVTVKTE